MPAALADPVVELVDACARTFESARRRGPTPLTDHLPPADHPGWCPALAELVRLDLEYGWAAGAPRPVADYLAEFPLLAADPALLGGVCFEEYRQRADRGEDVHPTEYAARFGVDTAGWDTVARPGTAVVSVTPAPANSVWATVPGAVAPVARPAPSIAPGRPPVGGASVVSLAPPTGVAAFPAVGDEFAGFALTAELGRGAFARVFLARQGELSDRPVAVKVTAAAADDSGTLARLQHANIVPVYSVHRRGPLAAVCMPYLGATTLADVSGGLQRTGLPRSGHYIVSTLAQRRSVTRPAATDPAPGAADPASADGRPGLNTDQLTRLSAGSYVDAVLWLVARLADGLQHAHDRGVLHRDIKPTNVLLTDDGQPMLLDFNLAADAASAGAAAARIGGTLPYMAPEHLAAFADDSGAVDARSDLYALGLVAFELLAGRPSYPVPPGLPLPRLLPAMREQRAAAPPRLRPFNPAVSPAVESIVRTLLAPDPAARYQTAKELKEDIERHLANRPLRVAPNPSARELLAKWTRRHPRLSSAGTLGAVAGLLLLAAGAGAFILREQARQDRAELQLRDLRADVARHATELGAGLADPTHLPAAYAAGRATLDRYGVPADPAWERRDAVRHLSAAGRDQLRREVGELASLLADVGRRAKASHAAPEAAGDAGRLAELAAELAPADDAPRGLFRAAFGRFNEREYADAFALARRAVDADPGRPAAWFLLGATADRLGRVGTAEAAYDAALAAGGDPYHVRMNRGLARLKSRQFREAEADFAACLALRPDDPAGYVNRAVARKDAGDPAGAVADLTAALDRGAPQTRVYFLRARLHRQLNNTAAAEADLATGLRLTPTDPVSWVSRALARRATDPQGAVADLDQALALDPESTVALQAKADVLAEELNDPAGSAAALTRLLEVNPRSVPALAGRAVVRARLGDRAGAVADAETALAIGRDPETVYMVAGVHALLAARHPDDKATALRLLTEALRNGYGFQHLATDPELKPLRGDAEFERVVAAARWLQPATK